MPEPPYVIEIICYLDISGSLDTRVTKELGIFTKSKNVELFTVNPHESHYHFPTVPMQIQHSISSISPEQNDRLHDIELMLLFMRHNLRIPGLSEESIAKYFLDNDCSSGTHQINYRVEFDCARFDTACIFDSNGQL